LGTRWVVIKLTDGKVIADSECREIKWLWARRMRSCEHARRNSQRVHVSQSPGWQQPSVDYVRWVCIDPER